MYYKYNIEEYLIKVTNYIIITYYKYYALNIIKL